MTGCEKIREIFSAAEASLRKGCDCPEFYYKNDLVEKDFQENILDIKIPDDFFACCEFYRMLKSAARHADISEKFSLADRIVKKMNATAYFFNKYLFDSDTVRKTAEPDMLAVPLALGLVPPHRERTVAKRLSQCAENPYDDSHICYVADMLCRYGYEQLAYELILRAKDIPEHCTVELAGWLFETLSGILPKNSSASHTVLAPVFMKKTAPFRAVYGDTVRIETKWHFEGNNVIYSFNTLGTVTLILPDGSVSSHQPGRNTVVYASGSYDNP